jgi:hypothetical protein
MRCSVTRTEAIARATVTSRPVPVVEAAIRRRPYTPRSPLTDWANRLTRCVAGLMLFGVGISLILHAELGAAPWDVFHQGVSKLTGISMAT